MPKLNWEDAESIGIELYEKHPDVDPLKVRFTDMHQWILALPDFTGAADKSNEAKLEAIQMAWYEEWKDNQ
jgi:FeS assembly protein IscX